METLTLHFYGCAIVNFKFEGSSKSILPMRWHELKVSGYKIAFHSKTT